MSIVIPVGPGESAWPALVARLRAGCPEAEVVLSASTTRPVDGSVDGLCWIDGRAGRAEQLNRGVASARGDVIWLLHADSRPDRAALAAARRFGRTVAPDAIGWFDLAFGRDGPSAARLNAIGANLRSRFAGLPFGDQGWILRRELFERIGGFDPEFGRGEDLDFIVRARAAGTRPVRIGARLETSARRYRRQGWLTTTLTHAVDTLRMVRRARARARGTAA